MIELTRRFAAAGPPGGVELAWDRWGPVTGRPLVLVHGWSGGAVDFFGVVPRLADGRAVVALDQRGHGSSTSTGDAATYTIEQLAADLTRFLDAAVGAPVDLLGHSMGGLVALHVALDHPELVGSLVLMDTSAWSFQSDDEATRDLFSTFFASFDPSRGLPNLGNLAGPERDLIDAAVSQEWRAAKDASQAAFDPYAFGALGSTLWRDGITSMRERLAAYEGPVTVLAGEHDHPFVDQAGELAAAVPHGRPVVLDGAYHSPQLTHADTWCDAVEDHLVRAAAPAAPDPGGHP